MLAVVSVFVFAFAIARTCLGCLLNLGCESTEAFGRVPEVCQVGDEQKGGVFTSTHCPCGGTSECYCFPLFTLNCLNQGQLPCWMSMSRAAGSDSGSALSQLDDPWQDSQSV